MPETHAEGIAVDSRYRGWVEITAPTRREHLKRLEDFVEVLSATALPEDDKREIKLVMSELCANAMEWGNRNDAHRKIRVSYGLFPDEIVFQIADEGEGFDHAHLPDPTANPAAHLRQRERAGKRLGGFGVHLARRIMDNVVYNDKGNVVILSRKLQGGRHG
ncbi:MAG: ATP-binding protein [Planctomycetota bacterium]